jgi:heme exporter protein D
MVVVFIIIILALIVQSFKYLRQVQQQEAAEKKNSQPERQLHPKLQQPQKEKDKI